MEDDANRNGIQEGPGLVQLKEILLYVISEFERDRQFVGRKLAAYEKEKDELAKKIAELERLAKARQEWEEEKRREEQEAKETREKSETQEKPQSEAPAANPVEVAEIISALQQKQEETIQELKDEVKMLQTLATTGIVTNMFMHEIHTLINNIGRELDSAYEALAYENNVSLAITNIKESIGIKKHFKEWFRITIESIKKDKRLRKKHNIHEMLEEFLKTWEGILDKNGVTLKWQCDPDIVFTCFEFDVENIISNLISNSMASFDRETGEVLEKKEIILTISSEETGFLIDYKDTGWGLLPKYKENLERIMEAFESSKRLAGEEEDGTGMGMWIVAQTALEYSGAWDLSENLRHDTGFYIKISLGG